MTTSVAHRGLEWLRAVERRAARLLHPHTRHLVFDARTSMEVAMMAPVARALSVDRRVRLSVMSSERPAAVEAIFRRLMPGAAILSPRRAMHSHIDGYVAADLLWATLPRGARRIQMFHGVAGKYSGLYDRPDASMRQWDRLFFINRRRLQNFIGSGAIDAGSPAARLVGMPKVDCLLDGTLRRDDVLTRHGIDPASRTVLYAPTWTPYSSLNALGESLVESLGAAGFTVLMKLHDNSRDLRPANSGGTDWPERLAPILARNGGHLVEEADASPWLAAADVMITDHSSVGFEYLLLDRPLVRIEMPVLLARTNIPPEYVELIADASTTTHDVVDTVAAVERAFASPSAGSASRRKVADDLFYLPGTATARACAELYDLLELDAPSLRAPEAAADVQPVLPATQQN
jgi:hypothetical protein